MVKGKLAKGLMPDTSKERTDRIYCRRLCSCTKLGHCRYCTTYILLDFYIGHTADGHCSQTLQILLAPRKTAAAVAG
jgi:hypothetical protein